MAATQQYSTEDASSTKQQLKKQRCHYAVSIALLLLLFIAIVTSFILFVINDHGSQSQRRLCSTNKQLCAAGIEGLQALVILITFLLIVIYLFKLCKRSVQVSRWRCLDLIAYLVLTIVSGGAAITLSVERHSNSPYTTITIEITNEAILYIAASVYLILLCVTLVIFSCSKIFLRRRQLSSIYIPKQTSETAPLLAGSQGGSGYSVEPPKPQYQSTTFSDVDTDSDHLPVGPARHPSSKAPYRPSFQATPPSRPPPTQATPQRRPHPAQAHGPMEQMMGELLNKVFSNLVKVIKEGMPELNIPSLDPLNIPGEKEVSISAMLVNVQGSFSDFSVAGLSLMATPEVSFKDQKVTATTNTKIEISGKYSLNGRVSGFISIGGNSTFTCTIGVLKATIGISYKDPNKLKAIVELKSTNVEVKLHDNAAATPVLSRLGGPIAKFIEESLGPMLQGALQKLIDQYVNDVGLTE